MDKPAIQFKLNRNGDLVLACLVGAFVLVGRKLSREVRRQIRLEKNK